jgi:excisionase family DNA binding protein
MPAYDIQQREQSTPLVQVDPAQSKANSSGIRRTSAAPLPLAVGEVSIIDSLLERLANRVAAGVIAHLEGNGAAHDEWLDSLQAANYLGLHRDTLRRLAAAGAIPAEQDGRGCKLFFTRAALDDWRRSGGRPRHLSAVANAA